MPRRCTVALPCSDDTLRLLALGDAGWTLQFGEHIHPDTHARVMGLEALLADQRTTDPQLASVTDVVPSFCSLTVHFDPMRADSQALGRHLLTLAQTAGSLSIRGRQWLLPVCFDDAFAPDLPRLCEVSGLATVAVIRFRVYMIGFQPGFPYMGGLPPELALPRLPSPRPRVPAQSVAIAGEMCAVYPWDSPGGWNLLGRTPVALFDPEQTERPALLSAGDDVQWHAVDRATHDHLVAEIARGLPRETFLRPASA